MSSSPKDGDIYEKLEQGKAARRGYAAFLLRMVSGYVLYRKSSNPNHRRIAFQAKSWIYRRRSSSPMSFQNICEILDLPVEQFREKIGTLRREDFLRKVKECIEESPQPPEEEPDDADGC